MKNFQSQLPTRPSISQPLADDGSIQITLRLNKRDLALIDEGAAKRRISRSGLLRQAVFKLIEEEK